MAAAHSNRSPSPLSSRPSDSNLRNSENNSAIRRSFSGYNAKPSVLTKPRRFDPVTPANSPSDFPRRRSVGKESTRSSLEHWEEKENDEKDLNFSKLRSPLKGSKNFMSPTISAASKFTPSPRKKVLVERNDPVRTSISLCDGKAMFFSSTNVSQDLDLKSEMGSDQNQTTQSSLDSNVSEKKEVVRECPPVSKPPKKVTFLETSLVSQHATESLQESVITDSAESLKWEPSLENKVSYSSVSEQESVVTDFDDSLKWESSLKNNVSCSCVSSSIAPLDAYPSLPPYDPETNYLSPRPQFLHYKPNPRIEILMNKEKGLDPDEFERLEDNFLAEILREDFSESEATEESETEDLKKEEMEVADSDDTVIGIEKIDPPVSELCESLPACATATNAVFEENLAQKRVKGPWIFSKVMCLSMLLVFSIICVSILFTHSDKFDQIVIKDMSLSHLRSSLHQSSIAASAKVNFDRVAKHVSQFSVNSIFFISELSNKYGKGEKLAPLQFVNLTDPKKSIWDEEYFLNNHVSKELVENIEEDDEMEEDVDTESEALEEETDAEINSEESFEEDVDAESEAFEEETYAEIDPDKCFKKEIQTQCDVLETEAESPDDPVMLAESKLKISASFEDQTEVDSHIHTEDWSNTNSETQVAIGSEVQEVNFEAEKVEFASDGIGAGRVYGEEFVDSSACADVSTLNHESPLDVYSSTEDIQSSPMLAPLEISENKFVSGYIIGVSAFFVALCGFAAFLYQQKKSSSLANVMEQKDPILSKPSDYRFASTKQIYQEKQFSHNRQAEVDVLGESCPSEMSSFQKSASYFTKELRGESEVQSFERRPRKFSKRESLASSSEFTSDSLSYGSFTTFERIPIKHANGENEVVTPVRRSSRLRNQVTSP